MLKNSNTENSRISDTSAKILAENVKAVYSVKKVQEYSGERISISDREKTGMKEERISNYVKLCEEWDNAF